MPFPWRAAPHRTHAQRVPPDSVGCGKRGQRRALRSGQRPGHPAVRNVHRGHPGRCDDSDGRRQM